MNLTIKFSANTLICTLAHPDAKPGISGNVSTYRVVNIPDDVPASRVLHLFDNTAIIFPDKLPVPYTVEYSALGMGKIIKAVSHE